MQGHCTSFKGVARQTNVKKKHVEGVSQIKREGDTARKDYFAPPKTIVFGARPTAHSQQSPAAHFLAQPIASSTGSALRNCSLPYLLFVVNIHGKGNLDEHASGPMHTSEIRLHRGQGMALDAARCEVFETTTSQRSMSTRLPRIRSERQ